MLVARLRLRRLIEEALPGDAAAEPRRTDLVVRTSNDTIDFLKTSHVQPINPTDARRATRLAVGSTSSS